MENDRPFRRAIDLLRQVNLRPTRQRVALARLLFENGERHVTAERLHEEAGQAGVEISLATVYNTLHQFTAAGLLREIMIDGTRAYFDTNTSDHHHFFLERDAVLIDIPADAVVISALPAAPDGTAVARVDVIVRLESQSD